MQQIIEIIQHKLQVIKKYERREEDGLAEVLMQEKKLECSRELLESRLQESLALRKLHTPFTIQQFYSRSQSILNIYDKKITHHQHQDPYDATLDLYVAFFLKHQGQRRAKELQIIYKKRLFEKNMLISLLLGWLAEWTKKVFQEFLKSKLQECNQKVLKKAMKKNNVRRKLSNQSTICRRNETLEQKLENKSEKPASLEKNIESNLFAPLKNQEQPELIYIRGSQILRSFSQSVKFKPNPDFETQESLLKKKTVQRVKKNNSNNKEENTMIIVNREILFSAYLNELNQYYKFNSILRDLDPGYPRSFRRVDRRDELKDKFDEVAKSIIKTSQGEIKKTCQQYYQSYQQRFLSKKKKNKTPKIQKTKSLRSQEYEKKRMSAIVSSIKIEKTNSLVANNSFQSRKKSLSQRKSISERKSQLLQRKTYEMNLPQILKPNSSTSRANKILFCQQNKPKYPIDPQKIYTRDFQSVQSTSRLSKDFAQIYKYQQKQRLYKILSGSNQSKKKKKRYEMQDLLQIEDDNRKQKFNQQGALQLPSIYRN